ncbi:hypothetical protein CEXT_383061 [Caerostris extrusa]|uniref:LAGLIDADG homing endonuclease n=1 Tax=Caerostris extrusa TaxID=172846 RepID=A0AAV4XRJ6_CAEEX|nr:hypothetical protein CEXT_383061 [Caerostris extrusa]
MKTRPLLSSSLPNQKWPKLSHELTTLIPKLNISLSRGQFLRLTVDTEEEYSRLKSILTQRKIPFRTNNLRKDQPLKVVIRGFPACTDKDIIRTAISHLNYTVLDVI